MDLVNIQKLEENEGVEQRSIDAQAMQKDAEEEKVFTTGVQPSTEVEMSTKVQPSVMEIDMSVLGFTKARRRATIMDKTTLLDKGIHISVSRLIYVNIN
jgi:hypothetical protein